jgi:2-oxoglutarate ferredoxin oxidoreductase subunit beta
MANPELLVIVAGGDGDGFSIGGGHVPHAIRRNPDLTYLVMDNQVYGLTKGQVSPTSPRGTKSHAASFGSIEEPVNPLLYALAYGAGFVAQAVPADLEGMTKIIEEAIRYPGFAFVNIQSPCVTFGDPENQAKVQKAKMRNLQTEGHDVTNHLRAMELAEAYGQTLYTGIFYRNPNPPPTYGSQIQDRQQTLKAKAPIEALA